MRGRKVKTTAALAFVTLASLSAAAVATHEAIDTEGHSTVEQTIVGPKEGDPYTNLSLGPGEPYVLRDGSGARPEDPPELPVAQPGREQRRTSLAYMSQMTDFQLADEESPARVEFVDPGPSSAWRPQEGMTPFQVEATVRQINRFADASPIPQGDGTRRPMDFGLLTGDQADNQHLNETVWVRDLLEGRAGPTNFNSGISDPAFYADPENLSPSCAAYLASKGGDAEEAAAEGARYTGVQDYDDYPFSPPPGPLFYDPDEPTGSWEDWPEYDGLMDRAQQIEIDPEGLAVPFYITNGNHDVLVQGNEDATQPLEEIATGCFKALGTTLDPTDPAPPDGPDPNVLLSPANVGMLVPPDPRRQFVSKPQIKDIYGATDEGPGDDDHGFAYVDPEEDAASNGSASYYAWDPEQTPGLRFISIDTNSEGGQTAETFVPGQPSTPGSSNGNIDHPQFQWLKAELEAAKSRDQIVVIFGHHPVRSMNTQIRDEQAVQCTTDDEHGHDVNPGCDHDPRPSFDSNGCIHNGTDEQNSLPPCTDAQHESFVELIEQFPNVVAYIPGHTHEHRLTPFVRTNGSTWWEVNTSAVIDYPNQSRLVELMDNRDGTLSLFNTVVDHAAPAAAPADCPDGATPQPDCAATFTEPQLASIGRALTWNDPDNDFSGAGRVIDRNAELLLEDPRRPPADLSITMTDTPDPVVTGSRLTYTLQAANAGPATSFNTRVTDELPPGMEVEGVQTTRGTCSHLEGTVACDIGTLATGASATITITVIPRQAGQVVNTARIRGNVTDNAAANDEASQTTTVTQGPGPATTTGTAGQAPACVSASAFAYADADPRGRRVAFSISRRTTQPAGVDVFQTSRGSKVLRERLVARFPRATRSFTWNGRANRRGRRVTDGVYFVRFRARDSAGELDVRRVTLRRARGRWSRRPAFHRPESCGVLAIFKLERPVFGGRSVRALRVAYRLSAPATVRVEVRRGRRVVKRFNATRRAAGRTYRLSFGARGRPRGDYRVRIVVDGPRGRLTRTLLSRRL